MATRLKTAKAPAKKAPAKKAPGKKAPAKKAPAKKAPAKKAAGRAPVQPPAREQGMTVEAYIAGLPDWRGETVSALRQLLREAAPGVSESIKWGQPVFDLNGPFAHVKALKNHVNFGFWRGAELADPKGLLKGTGNSMRHVELRGPADIDKAALQAMVRDALALNGVKGDPSQWG